MLSAAGPAAQSSARPLTLSWDANPEPDVVGYIVHVGLVSGSAHAHHDVGNNTSFVYATAVPGQRYYFTVSAYTVDRIESPRSDEVSAIAVGVGSFATSTAVTGQLDLKYVSSGRLSGVTALQDGRLLLIENDRSIRLLAPESSVAQTVLDDGDLHTAFTEVVVNSGFPTTHHVFVGVVNRRDAETHEFTVVRYREVRGNLGEGATVIAPLRFTSAHGPRFTVDDEERIYVAMPAATAGRADPYAGNILRFNADGTVPKENHAASPVFARGFNEPAHLGWDGRELVAIGADAQWSHAAGRLDPDLTGKSSPPTLEPMALGSPAKLLSAALGVGNTATNRGLRAYIDASQRLFGRVTGQVEHLPTFEEIALPSGATPVAVAAGFDGQIYLIVRSAVGQSQLLELGSRR